MAGIKGMWKISGATPAPFDSQGCKSRAILMKKRAVRKKKRGGGRWEGGSEWVIETEGGEHKSEGERKWASRTPEGAFCPFLHHPVLLVLLFRLSKHQWSLIKPENCNLHTHVHSHTVGTGDRGWGAFKSDLQTLASLCQQLRNFNGGHFGGGFRDLAWRLFGASLTIFQPFWGEWPNRTWGGFQKPFWACVFLGRGLWWSCTLFQHQAWKAAERVLLLVCRLWKQPRTDLNICFFQRQTVHLPEIKTE